MLIVKLKYAHNNYSFNEIHLQGQLYTLNLSIPCACVWGGGGGGGDEGVSSKKDPKHIFDGLSSFNEIHLQGTKTKLYTHKCMHTP